MTSNTAAVLRVDTGVSAGLGHLSRSLALAEELRSRGVNPFFLLSAGLDRAADMTREAGFSFNTLDADIGPKADCEQMLETAERQGAGLLVTDSYRLDAQYLRQLRAAGFLVCIDDLNYLSDYAAHLIVNPNLGAERFSYRTSGQTVFLLGASYFLFRDNWRSLAGSERHVADRAKRVLIFLGGDDTNRVLPTVLAGLARLDGLDVRVVGGYDVVPPEILASPALDVEIARPPVDMSSLMFWADVAIISGGLTKYEAALAGTPAVLLPQVDHQVELSKIFADAGTCINLGFAADVSSEAITNTVASLAEDTAGRQRMSAAGRRLLDGRGAERVVDVIVRMLTEGAHENH